MCIICYISRDGTVARDKAGDAAGAAAALPGGLAGGARGTGPSPALIVALPAVYSDSSSQRCLLGAPRGRCCRDGIQPSGGAGWAGGPLCGSSPPGRGCRQGGRAPLAGSEVQSSRLQSRPGLLEPR